LSNKKLGFGIIGSGFIAGIHAEAIQKIEQAYLAGVYDLSSVSAAKFAEKYGTAAFYSIEDMLQTNKVDVICICTPSGLHKDYAVIAAKAGKHLVIEKPLALTASDCDAILLACEENKVKATVISQLRYSHGYMQLKHAIDQGWLGKITSGSIYMKYYRNPEYYRGSWRGTKAMDGGGALMNQGIHGVDLLQHIMGKVKSVYGISRTLFHEVEVEDTLCAALEYENGAVGVIEATTSVYPGFNRRMEICGTKGSMVLTEDEITFYEFEDKGIAFEDSRKGTGQYSANDNTNISINGHVCQLTDFVHSLITVSPVGIDCKEGKKSVELITAIYQSSEEKKPIML